MKQLTVTAPAKINLTLNMEGVREDGYHLLSSVFQTVSLCDRVTLTETQDGGITLTMSDPALPTDARNTAYKAAQLFFEYTALVPRVAMYVEKIIPQQAGLGGGSADAAAVLVGLNALFETQLSVKELCALGERVGADVPFCIVGGTAMVRGIGEIIEPLAPLKKCAVVIVKPDVGVSTKEAYAAVDHIKTIPADQEAMCHAVVNGDLKAVGELLSNAFEQALDLPQVDEALAALKACKPLGCAMSGSGSAVFALFENIADAERCAYTLGDDVRCYVCEPCSCGPTVVL